jgi:hypothetical protein
MFLPFSGNPLQAYTRNESLWCIRTIQQTSIRTSPRSSDVSLLLVRPGAVLYSERNDDPILPALDLAKNNESYQNSLWHATALGCADATEIRYPDMGQTWIPKNFT